MELISVNDRLPEQHKYVLVYSLNDYDYRFSAGFKVACFEYNDKKQITWYYGKQCHELTDVTHWSELPEPPKT